MSDPKIVFDHIHLISPDPETTATWYTTVLGGEITSVRELRGAPQFAIALPGITLLIRGQRPGEQPNQPQNLQSFKNFVGHNQWGTDHFGFIVQGNLDAFCEVLRKKGATFSVEPHDFLPDTRLAYLEAPDGVSIELVQA